MNKIVKQTKPFIIRAVVICRTVLAS